MIIHKQVKSLKDQNRWQLWLIIVANGALFYAVPQVDRFLIAGFKATVADASNILPLGLAYVITTLANGLLSSKIKERLVFLKWNYALPGHRAFSKLAATDPRIDVVRLKKALGYKLPTNPEDENRVWYRIYKEVESDAAVQHVQRDYLLMRDYTGLAIMLLMLLSPASFMIIQSWKVDTLYSLFLVLQVFLVRQAAANYGRRFVCTVLALKAAKPAVRKAAAAQ